MNTKTLIQILLGFIIISILVVSYTKFLSQKKNNQSVKTNIEVDNANEVKGDIIEINLILYLFAY